MKAQKITHAEAHQNFAYDKTTGCFTWLIKTAAQVNIGDQAGTLHYAGYVFIQLTGQRFLAHRLAWFYVHGVWPVGQIDHINGIRHDNRIENLRDVCPATNAQNRKSAQKNSKTGIIGVSKRGNGFVANIGVRRKLIYLGFFPTVDAASLAYQAAKVVYHTNGAQV